MFKYAVSALFLATQSVLAAPIPSGTTSVDIVYDQRQIVSRKTISTPYADPTIFGTSEGGVYLKTVDLVSNQAYFDVLFVVDYREVRRAGSKRFATALFSGVLDQTVTNPTSTQSLRFGGTLTNQVNGETMILEDRVARCQPICSLFASGPTYNDVLTFETAVIRLNAVPIPAPGLLLAGGMLALSLGGRKKLKKKAAL